MKPTSCTREARAPLPSSCARWQADETFVILCCNKTAPESAFWLWSPKCGRLERLVVPYPEETEAMANVIRNRPPERWRPPSEGHVAYLARYQLSPHAALPIGAGRLICGQLCGLNTYLLDTRSETYTPLCSNESSAWSYCPTPGANIGADRVVTARWQIYNDHTPADATHYSEVVGIDLRDGDETVYARVPIADNIHQVAPLPDGRHVLLNEFRTGLNGTPPDLEAIDPVKRLEILRGIGVSLSRVALVDLQTGDCSMWTCPYPSPAHIVVDPDDPAVSYLACHNMVIHAGVMHLFGPGCLVKLRIVDHQIQMEGHYTHPMFYRLSTHQLVTCRGRKAIAVTVYPNRCELIDAERFTHMATVDLYPIVSQGEGGSVAADNQFESAFSLCGADTEDLLVLSGSRRVYVVDLSSDPPCVESIVYNNDRRWEVRAHMARLT